MRRALHNFQQIADGRLRNDVTRALSAAQSRVPRLDGQVALVAGGSRGIGRGLALRLAQLGASVAVVSRDLFSYRHYPEDAVLMEADTVAEEIAQRGGDSLGLEADLIDTSAAARTVERVLSRWGRLDIVVCSAGGGSGLLTEGRPSSLSWAVIEEAMRMNVATTTNVCASAAPTLKQQRSGVIVTLVSASAVVPTSGGAYAHYGMAKAALVAYTRALAQDLGPFGIRVNALAPGPTATGRMSPLLEAVGGARLARAVPLRRLGTVEDCANVLEFVVSDLAGFVTGQVISCDGGVLQGPR